MNSSRVNTGFGYAKALIFGEYAVMHGAPGMVMALTPKIHARLGSPRANELEVKPGCFTERVVQAGREVWHVDASVDFDVDDGFESNGQKNGIGSSSASVAAYCDAVRELLGESQIDIEKAIRMHRWIQGGMGSGIDIIGSCLGGVHIVRGCPDQPEIDGVCLRNVPKIAIFATHHQAPTCEFIGAAKVVEGTRAYRRVMDELAGVYEGLCECVKMGNISDFLELSSGVTALLRRLGDIIGKPVVPALLDAMLPVARDCHVVLKTSGAGGGDIFLAMSNRMEAIDEFAEQAVGHMTRLEVDVAPERELR